MIAIAAVLGLAVFAVLAWRAGGPQPLKEVAVSIRVPDQSK